MRDTIMGSKDLDEILQEAQQSMDNISKEEQ